MENTFVTSLIVCFLSKKAEDEHHRANFDFYLILFTNGKNTCQKNLVDSLLLCNRACSDSQKESGNVRQVVQFKQKLSWFLKCFEYLKDMRKKESTYVSGTNI